MPTKTRAKVDVKPLHDKIIVRRDEAETQTESGIFLPESSKERPKTGTVEAVGNGRLNTETGERTPLSVKSGDHVIFNEDDVLAVFD